MARTVASYLLRFDEPIPEPLVENISETRSTFRETLVVENEIAPEVDLQTQIYEAAYAAAKLEFDDILERERRLFTERMLEERSRWASEQGEHLGDAFCVAIAENVETLKSALERLLEPFVLRNVLDALIADFVETVQEVVSDRNNPLVELRGPADLLEIISARLDSAGITASIIDSADVEVKAKIGPTVIETRVAEWLTRIRGGDIQ